MCLISESGQQVTLETLLGKSREECYQLLQEAYRDKLRENPGVYYADAEEKIAALNPEKIGWYFTETAIVCYLEPYTIALPEEGYVEASCRLRMIVNKILMVRNTHQGKTVRFSGKSL